MTSYQGDLELDDRIEQAMDAASTLHITTTTNDGRPTIKDIQDQIFLTHGYLEKRDFIAELDLHTHDPEYQDTNHTYYTPNMQVVLRLDHTNTIVNVETTDCRIEQIEHEYLKITFANNHTNFNNLANYYLAPQEYTVIKIELFGEEIDVYEFTDPQQA